MKAKEFLRNNGLFLTFFLAFLLSLCVGQLLTGLRVSNEDLAQHGWPAQSLLQYLGSGHFLEATLENWESEFLQMFAFVLATAWLFQKGSAESRDPAEVARPMHPLSPGSPWAAKRGGWIKAAYSHSLSGAFLLCFLASFWLHAVGGAREYNHETLLHGGASFVSAAAYMGTARFWFESFQNWQSEFLSIAAMVLFSIHLREKGSSQSKPVESPHERTGS